MEIDDLIVEKYISYLKPEAYAVLTSIIFRCSKFNPKKKVKMAIKTIERITGLTRPTIFKHLETLANNKFICTETKIIDSKKTRLFRVLKTPKINKALYPKDIDKNTIKSSKNTKRRYRIVFNNILEKVLEYPRYNNDYYKNKKYRFGAKEQNHIKTLVNRVKDIDSYIDWWLKNKSSRIPGLSMGIICCIPIIEEYELKSGKSLDEVKRESKKPIKRNLDRISKIRKENIRYICEEITEAKGKGEDPDLSPEDERILRKAVRENLIIKTKNGYRLNFK